MNNAKKPEGKKAAVKKTAAPAENKNTVKETAVTKAETKSSAAAKSTVKKTAKAEKPVAKKADTKTAKTTKPAAKTTAKSVGRPAKTETAAKKPARKTAKKSNAVTIQTICEKTEKMISKTKVAAIKEKIAVDIEVWGFEDGSNNKMYIEINDGKVTVAPHTYDEKNFRVSLSFANAAAFVDGKLTLKSLIESQDFYAEGNIVSAIKLASVF